MRKRDAVVVVKPVILCEALSYRGLAVDRNYLLDDIAFAVAAAPIGWFGIDAVELMVAEQKMVDKIVVAVAAAVAAAAAAVADDMSDQETDFVIK